MKVHLSVIGKKNRLKVLVSLILLAFLTQTILAPFFTSAISDEQKRVYNKHGYWYDVACSNVGSNPNKGSLSLADIIKNNGGFSAAVYTKNGGLLASHKGGQRPAAAASTLKPIIVDIALNLGIDIDHSDITAALDIRSDNDAANRIINKVGINKLNSRLKNLGYENTQINNIFNPPAPVNGGNKTSAKDIAKAMVRIQKGSGEGYKIAREALASSAKGNEGTDYWGNEVAASKWGGTSDVSSVSVLTNSIEGSRYIIGVYVNEADAGSKIKNIVSQIQDNLANSGGKGEASDNDVYFVGDSIGVGMKDAGELRQKLLKRGFDKISIDAVGSRSMTSPGFGSKSGMQVIDSYVNELKKSDKSSTFIIELGTNSSGITSSFKSDAETAVSKIKAANENVKIYWVKVFSNVSHKASYNQVIDQLASSQGINTVDMSSLDLSLPDGLHPNAAGYKTAASFLAREVTKEGGGFSSSSSDSTANCACPSGGGTTELSGKDNAEKIWNFFIAHNFTENQVAGILGNFWVETGGTFDPTITQGGGNSDEVIVDGVTGYGLAQWTYPTRQQGLKDFSNKEKYKSQGLKSGSLEVQLDYVMHELKNGYAVGWGKSISIDDATHLWETAYENPQPGSLSTRQEKARELHADFSGKSGGGTVSDGSGGGGCAGGGGGEGEVIDGIAWPVPKKWWKSNPDYFTSPHHTYAAVDIPVPNGTEVYSMLDGTVVAVTSSGDCGNGVIIDSENDTRLTYCHGPPGSVKVSGGDRVKAGQQIMLSNDTGDSSGPHLHVQITVGGVKVCPQNIFKNLAENKGTDLSKLPTSGCVG